MGEACRQQGLASIPVAADALGGTRWLPNTSRSLVQCLPGTRVRMSRLKSLLLMRGNANLLLNRVPEDDATVDGIEGILLWFEITKQITYRECNRDQIV